MSRLRSLCERLGRLFGGRGYVADYIEYGDAGVCMVDVLDESVVGDVLAVFLPEAARVVDEAGKRFEVRLWGVDAIAVVSVKPGGVFSVLVEARSPLRRGEGFRGGVITERVVVEGVPVDVMARVVHAPESLTQFGAAVLRARVSSAERAARLVPVLLRLAREYARRVLLQPR